MALHCTRKPVAWRASRSATSTADTASALNAARKGSPGSPRTSPAGIASASLRTASKSTSLPADSGARSSASPPALLVVFVDALAFTMMVSSPV